MASGFRDLYDTVQESEDKILEQLQQLILDQGSAYQESQLNVLVGQQDLSHTLERISQNIRDALGNSEDTTASTMRRLLAEQYQATQNLLTAVSQNHSNAVVFQLQKLVSHEQLL